MRIGQLESLILRNIESVHEDLKKFKDQGVVFPHIVYDHGYSRTTASSWDKVPTIWIRNHIFGVDFGLVSAAQKASFSRAIRKLRENKLIECWNHASGKENYVTHIKLTDEGKAVLDRIKQKQVKKNPNVNFHAMA